MFLTVREGLTGPHQARHAGTCTELPVKSGASLLLLAAAAALS